MNTVYRMDPKLQRELVTHTLSTPFAECASLRAKELVEILKDHPDFWICLDGGPVTRVDVESGANEPFVYLGCAKEKTA